MTKIIIDFPSGWRYGFPKPCPEEVWKGDTEGFKAWAIDNGYPASEINFAIGYCRCWYEDTDDEEN